MGINYWNLINVLLYKPVLVLDHMHVFNCQLFHMNHKTTLNPTQKQERERERAVYIGFSSSQTLEDSIYSSLATMLKHLKASPHFLLSVCLYIFILLATLIFRVSAESSITQGLRRVTDTIHSMASIFSSEKHIEMIIAQ